MLDFLFIMKYFLKLVNVLLTADSSLCLVFVFSQTSFYTRSTFEIRIIIKLVSKASLQKGLDSDYSPVLPFIGQSSIVPQIHPRCEMDLLVIT